MLDQFGLDVGPGYVGGGGDTVQSISLANGGTGGGGWDDPGVWNQYNNTQQDVGAIRELMAASGQPHFVTGTGSMANPAAGDSVAYLPSMMEAYGVTPTQGVLNSYENLVGSEYAPGSQITGYDNNSDRYTVGQGSGMSGADLMAYYSPGGGYEPEQVGAGPAPQPPAQAHQYQVPQSQGGLGQVAVSTQVPLAQSVSTPASAPTANSVSDQAIQNWFNQNPNWTPDILKTYMASYGISPEQVARVTGNRPETLVERYNATGRLPAQAGARTQYVGYTQPLAPVSQGAGSGNAPYYYQTPNGQVASYLPPAYWRGNVQAYGGMYPFAEGGAVKSAESRQHWLKAKCNG